MFHRVAVTLKYRNGYWACISDVIADRKLDPSFRYPISEFRNLFSLPFFFYSYSFIKLWKLYTESEFRYIYIYIFVCETFPLRSFFLQTAKISGSNNQVCRSKRIFEGSFEDLDTANHNFRDKLIYKMK